MQIENLIQIVDNDLVALRDKNTVILEYINGVENFSNRVERYNSKIDWIIPSFLQNVLFDNNIIKERHKNIWRIFGSEIDVFRYDGNEIFYNKELNQIQISYELLTKATAIKPESLGRINIQRGGLRNFFDVIVRHKNAQKLMQSSNYQKYLEGLYKKGMSYAKYLDNRPEETNGVINIHDYKTIKSHLEVMSDILNRELAENNDFIFLWRGDEYEGNQESFQILFEKILDSASCLK